MTTKRTNDDDNFTFLRECSLIVMSVHGNDSELAIPYCTYEYSILLLWQTELLLQPHRTVITGVGQDKGRVRVCVQYV
jgi:hypothetical protein